MSPLWATHRKKKNSTVQNEFLLLYEGRGYFLYVRARILHETIHITELFAVLFFSYHFPFRFLLVAYLTFRKLCHDFTGLMFLRVIVQFSVFSVYFAFVEAPTPSI